MRKLTVMEFKKFCRSLSVNKFILHNENQVWNEVDNTFSFEIELSHISVAFNPNVIRLISSNSCIDLKRVKYIKIDDSSVLGLVLTVVCGNYSDTSERSYTIIAQ